MTTGLPSFKTRDLLREPLLSTLDQSLLVTPIVQSPDYRTGIVKHGPYSSQAPRQSPQTGAKSSYPGAVYSLTTMQTKISLEGQLAYTTVSAILEWNRKMRTNRAEVTSSFAY